MSGILRGMSYFAAIDIGSNAIRLAIAHKIPEGVYLSYRSREPVRLGSSVFSDGVISEDIYKDLKTALRKFNNQMENHNVLKCRAIATSAMREAKNSAEIVERLKKKTGIEIEVISGEEEARLVFTAISRKIDLHQDSYLLIDIGGGSIELVAIVDGKIIKKQSFVLGMVRTLELQKKFKQDFDQWFPKIIEEETRDFFKDLPALKTAVGTGGSMDRFIKMKGFVSGRDGMDLKLSEMKDLYKKLKSVSYKERIAQFGLKPDRADVIIPAAVATIQLMKLGGCRDILLPEVGIKDGVLYELSLTAEN